MTEALQVIRLKLSPDTEQASYLDHYSKICSWSYNQLLDFASDYYKQYQQTNDKHLERILFTEEGLTELLPKLLVLQPGIANINPVLLHTSAHALTSHILELEPKEQWPQAHNANVDWFSLGYREPDSGYRVGPHTLDLYFGKDEHQQPIMLQVPIANPEKLKNKRVRQLTLFKSKEIYYAEFLVFPELGKPKPFEDLKNNQEKFLHLQYDLLVDEAYGHRQFGEVTHPNKPEVDLAKQQGLSGGPAAHPLLKDSAYFNGIDNSVNPLPDQNPDGLEAYNELKYSHVHTPQPTFSPKPQR